MKQKTNPERRPKESSIDESIRFAKRANRNWKNVDRRDIFKRMRTLNFICQSEKMIVGQYEMVKLHFAFFIIMRNSVSTSSRLETK